MKPVASPYLVPFDDRFRIDDAPRQPPGDELDRDANEAKLGKSIKKIRKLQKKLYADDRFALLLVFQAMDAAGKDGTIKAVMTGINPAGCQVYSFKQPSAEERDHDFLWRIARCLPERGRIGIFNRSHYEEVLVVRVHPEYLEGQSLPSIPSDLDELWSERYDSIRDFERHLARNGTVVLKFFLNVSRDEQKRRFLDRIDEPESNWKFSKADVEERSHWNAYMHAYEAALNATSRPWAPWYAIPADDKPFMRRQVAKIIQKTLDELDIDYPKVTAARRRELHAIGSELRDD
jgi:PPK2 family polyphosphate:nucleotide phosphotransferase